MGMDRFIKWGPAPEWGPPTLKRLAQVARDFLGSRWTVTTNKTWIVCETDEPQTFPLRAEHRNPVEGQDVTSGELRARAAAEQTRGFEVFFPVKGRTSVITRHADPYSRALADEYARIIARWWSGEIEWPS